MANFTASTALRDVISTYLDGLYYWVTLHDATGGFAAGDVYVAGIHGELADLDGYLQGGKSTDLVDTNGVLDGPDVVWNADDPGTIGPVSYIATWVGTSATIAGAGLLSVEDKSADPQSASNGGPFTATIANPVTIPTPT